MDAIETIEIDGYVGRIEYQDYAEQPDQDGDGHMIELGFSSFRGRIAEVCSVDFGRCGEAAVLADALDAAYERWGSDWDKIERYLRAFHGVVGIDRTHWSRGSDLLCLITADLAEAWGCDPRNITDQEATGGLAAWRAYRDGEVYGYTVETEDGETLDSCWGYYGDDELEYIRSQIHDVINAHKAEVHAKRAAMYRELVNA